jgi:hypothetical protein
MNESSEKFMASVGLTSADFEISQSVVDRLSENEQNEVPHDNLKLHFY